MYCNGVILVSMTNLGIERGVDMAYATALPGGTAVRRRPVRLGVSTERRPPNLEQDGAVPRHLGGVGVADRPEVLV